MTSEGREIPHSCGNQPKRETSRRHGLLVPLICAAMLVALSLGVSAEAADGEYVIGGNQDMSGPLAYIGGNMATGSRAYFDAMNAKGEINGHQVRYLPLDHHSDTATGIGNVRSLVQGSNAIAILGFDSSLIVDSALAEVQRGKVVALVQGATLASVKSPWEFNSAAFIPDEAAPMFAFAEQQVAKPQAKVAILQQETSATAGWLKNLLPLFQAKGWQVVSNQSVTLASTEIGPQLSAMAQANPDIVFTTMSGPKIALSVNGMRKLGFDGPILGHTPQADVVSMKNVRDAKFFVMRELAFSGDAGKGVTRMDDDIRHAKADPDAAWIINGYVQALIVGDALTACGWPCSSDRLRQTLERTRIDTQGVTFGPIAYTPDNHRGFTKVRFYRWNSGSGQPEAVSGDIDY